MSRKKKTIHYAITLGCEANWGVEIIGITDNETIARKFCENYNRINKINVSTVCKFQDFKELGSIYLSPQYSENNFYCCERKVEIKPSGKIETSFSLQAYPYITYNYYQDKRNEVGKVRHRVNHYIERFTMILSQIFLWAPNEDEARKAAYKAFEENQFGVLKDYLENTSET